MRSGSRTWTARGPPRPCSPRPETTSAASRSIPRRGKIYWANFSTNEIRVGNLNGTGASTLFTDPGGSAPSGVAIDPANNKIYWTNQFSDEVRVGNLDGSGTAQTLFSGEDNPIGVAVDPAAGKIYWTDLNSGTVRVGPLGGSTVGVAQTLFNSERAERAGDRPDDEQDLLGQLDVRLGDPGREPGRHRHRLDPVRRREHAALRRAAEGACEHRAPGDLRRSQGREGAHLQDGTWAPDLLAAFLFRAPASFAYQWKRNGSNIATGPTFTPNLAGDYTCTVTATNQAGSTSQTSSVKKVKVK